MLGEPWKSYSLIRALHADCITCLARWLWRAYIVLATVLTVAVPV